MQGGVSEYRFGPYRLEPRTSPGSKRPWRLLKNNEEVDLTALTCRLLIFLLEHRGERIPNGRIILYVWQGKDLVDEQNSLDELVTRLRTLLDDDGRYIDRGEGEIEFVHPVEVFTTVTQDERERDSVNQVPPIGGAEAEIEDEMAPQASPTVVQTPEVQPSEIAPSAIEPKQPPTSTRLWLIRATAGLGLLGLGLLFYWKVSPAAHSQPISPTSRVGISLWRLQGGQGGGDQGKRIIEHPQSPAPIAEVLEWIPEIAHSGFVVSPSERIRLGVNSEFHGFIYVVDRELYSDRETADGVLIFPTARIQNGSNEIIPGMKIDIPSARDAPPFLEVKRSSKTHIGEELTVLLLNEARADLRLAAQPLRITKQALGELKFHAFDAILLDEKARDLNKSEAPNRGALPAQNSSELLYSAPSASKNIVITLSVIFRQIQ